MSEIITPPVKNEAKADKGASDKANAIAEANAFRSAVAEMLTIASGVKALAMDQLAIALGKSTSKAGRPSEEAYTPFFLAATQSRLTYERWTQLAKLANASVPVGHKPVAKQEAKRTDARGSATFRFSGPASVPMELGGS